MFTYIGVNQSFAALILLFLKFLNLFLLHKALIIFYCLSVLYKDQNYELYLLINSIWHVICLFAKYQIFTNVDQKLEIIQ